MIVGRHRLTFLAAWVALSLGGSADSGWAAGALPPIPSSATLLSLTVGATQTPRVASPGAADLLLLSITITNNDPLFPRSLRSLRVTNTTSGTGSVAQKDAELGTCRLYRDTGNGAFDASDVLLKQSTASGGAVTFSSLDQSCPAGSTVRLLVVTNVPLVARDGDNLDLAIASGSDLTFDQSVSFSNSFPIAPGGSFPVDGMTAAQIAVGPVDAGNLQAGTSDNLVFHMVVPANGYASDQLQQLSVVNLGTAKVGEDITALRAWVDDGDATFEPLGDRNLGTMVYTGARWQMTGLTESVPSSGLRLFLTVDVANLAREGRTVLLELPTVPDVGLGMASNNDGPLDGTVTSPTERVVSTANRVTLAATPLPPAVAHPGERGALLLHITATNSYGSAQTLDRLTIENSGTGGTTDDRDRAVQSLTLRADGNGDGALGDSLTDPAIATAFFGAGSASFTGFGLTLPGGASRDLFVTAEVSLAGATDADTLSARIAGPSDVGLGDTTRVTASWPLDSRARVAIDGMVVAQLSLAPVAGATLAPDDSGVLALDLLIPRNGRLDDTLLGLDLVNLGSATDADLAEVRLWRDGGDGVFTGPAGDDRDLGFATWTGTAWRSPSWAEAVGAVGARLFVVLRVAGSAGDSATVRLAVPVSGITVASGNDGPLDQAIANPAAFLISNSPLLAALDLSPEASSVGQTIAAAMVVRNVGSEALQGVTPSALTPSGSGTLTLQSGPSPSTVDLSPGESDTLRWTYAASGPGDIRLTGRAQGTGSPSGTPRASLDATSNSHRVFSPATSLGAAMTALLPGSVARGQTGVVPLRVSLSGAGGAETAPVLLRALRVALESEAGGPIVPDRLLSRVAVYEGASERLSRTVLESSGSEIALTLASPIEVLAGESVELTVSFDVLDSTTVSAFRVSVLDSSWFVAEDANSGAPVPVRLTSGAFPVRTGVAQVVEEADHVQVTASVGSPQRVGPGQADIALLALRFLSPGASGITSDVRVSALAVDASDTLGVPLARLADVLSRIQVRTAFQTLAATPISATDGPSLTLLLSPALAVPVNTPVDLFLSGDIAGSAAPGTFRLRLSDSTRCEARDANTRRRVPVLFSSDPLPGTPIVVEMAAESLRVRGTPRMPSVVHAGEAGVPAMSIVLYHPGAPGTARVRVDSLIVVSRDDARRPLPPAFYLDRLRVTWDGVEAGVQNDPPSTGEATAIALGGRILAPSDSAVLELSADFAAIAPEGFIELSVFAAGLRAFDANLGGAVRVAPAAGELPLLSGLAHLQAPPRTLMVGMESRMPAALAGDGRPVTAGLLALSNPAAAGAGAISLDHLTLEGGDRNRAPIALGSATTQLSASVNGQPWAQSGPLTPDSLTATLVGSTPLEILPGTPTVIELSFVPQSPPASSTLRLGLEAAGVGVVQPSSALLQIQVQPQAGQTFTLWTEPGSFASLDLAKSYSNFPNPFAAGREATSFAYYLAGPARVWLRVFTLEGEPVATLAEGEARAAGMNQGDRWSGLNGVGRTVRNGVYVAELVVRYDGGSTQRVLRKVAVAR